MKAGSGAARVNVNTQLSLVATKNIKKQYLGGANSRNEPSSVVFALFVSLDLAKETGAEDLPY